MPMEIIIGVVVLVVIALAVIMFTSGTITKTGTNTNQQQQDSACTICKQNACLGIPQELKATSPVNLDYCSACDTAPGVHAQPYTCP